MPKIGIGIDIKKSNNMCEGEKQQDKISNAKSG